MEEQINTIVETIGQTETDIKIKDLEKTVKELTLAFQAAKTQRDAATQRASDLELQLYVSQQLKD